MPRSAPPLALHLDVGVDATSGAVSGAVVRALAGGQLADGDLLPSTRVLAEVLGVPRARVVDVYLQLAASGFVITVPGSGTRVERGAGAAARAGAAASYQAAAQIGTPPRGVPRHVRFDLRPGYPDASLINTRDWSQAWRRAAQASVDSAAKTAGRGYPGPDNDGDGALRIALADHLRLSRGIAVGAGEVVLFAGVRAAIQTISRVAVDPARTLAFENPGYVKALRAFEQAGVAIRSIPVDEAGLQVDRLGNGDWGVYVTPAHQYPMGCRLPVSRRHDLIQWAERVDGYIFEDDYDGEYRYDVAPLPPMRSTAAGPRRVIYIGTASKILSHELRIAWAVIPDQFRGAVRDEQRRDGDAVNGVAAGALAELIRSGALVRHLALSQRTYAARRRRFAEACALELPNARVHGVEAGLHFVLTFEGSFDDVSAVADLERVGVLCAPLSLHRRGGTGPRGLVCGYGQLPETHARAAARLVHDVLSRLPGEPKI